MKKNVVEEKKIIIRMIKKNFKSVANFARRLEVSRSYIYQAISGNHPGMEKVVLKELQKKYKSKKEFEADYEKIRLQIEENKKDLLSPENIFEEIRKLFGSTDKLAYELFVTPDAIRKAIRGDKNSDRLRRAIYQKINIKKGLTLYTIYV